MDVDPQLDPARIAAVGYIHAINEKVAEYLRAVPALNIVTNIFDEDSKDAVQLIQNAMQGSEKLSLMIGTGECKDAAIGVPDVIRFDPMEVLVLCMEQPMLNRDPTSGTNVTVNRLAEIVACSLKGKQIAQSFFVKADFRQPSENLGSVAARLVVLTISANVAAS